MKILHTFFGSAANGLYGSWNLDSALGDVKDAHLSVLIPNMKGYELAVGAGATAVAMVLYATDEMADANVRMTMAEADAATEAIITRAQADGVSVMATISVSFECPFAGKVDAGVVRASAALLIGQRGDRGDVLEKLLEGVSAILREDEVVFLLPDLLPEPLLDEDF